MMKKHLYILLTLGFSLSVCAQSNTLNFENKIVEHFRKQNWDNTAIRKDSLFTNPYDEKFKLFISENAIPLDTTNIVIKNPYFSEKYEDAEEERDYVKNFPKSFSVIYENTLIALFEKGKFACYKLDSFERDTNLENQLNTKKFKYHWIINNQLGALSGNSIFIWNGKNWKKLKSDFPLKNQPKLFEDKDFIVYGDCHGEWGGTVYFYEKTSSKTFFTESTCTNSVIKSENGYEVLAHLGHGGGFAELKVIKDPRKLTLAKEIELNTRVKGEALGYTDKTKAFEKKFDFFGVQIFSSFLYKQRKLYIVNHSELTFIAEIKDGKIEIVNPLFFNDLYTHDPITNQYGDYTLINLDHYGTGLEREISVIILKEDKLTLLDWNENHSR